MPYNNDEEKKKKNEELKKRVKMLTMESKGSAKKKLPLDQQSNADTESQISSAPDHTFLTKPKIIDTKKKPTKRDEESPTARAAMALALMNNKEDKELLAIESYNQVDSRKLGQIAEDELNQTEKEMHNMMKELNEIEDMIKGNTDLGEMDTLMKSTNEVIEYHKSTTDTLKK